jgi:tripartite-type tricarboxylate transporter receptor subunit TctC
MARAGTPDAVLARLEAAANAALDNPEIKKRLLQMDLYRKPMKRGEISGYLSKEVEGWKQTAAKTGIRLSTR